MSAETVAYATLSGAAAVTTLVDTRIYPDFVPQEKTLPALAINRAETEYIRTIHSATPIAERVTLEFWCMAATRKEAEQLADVALTALADANFAIINRAPEFDAENGVYAAVLTAVFLDQ